MNLETQGREMWIRDKPGSRQCGSRGHMVSNLEEAIETMLEMFAENQAIEAEFWAEHAWHWALALNEVEPQ